jgi:hypothetical protein
LSFNLAFARPLRIVGLVQRSLATKLIAVLLLLALIAGGDRFAAMAMDMDGMQMSDMQKPDMNCQSCDGMMADTSCDAVCTALPAIDSTLSALTNRRVHERWMMHADSGAATSVRPDTTPPRA